MIRFSLSLIIGCALCYFIFGVSHNDILLRFDLSASFDTNLSALLNSFYFSVVTFTTLGYGDITPTGFSRVVAAIEAFLAAFHSLCSWLFLSNG